MRRGILIPLLFIIFTSTTGASIIDKETKQGVLDLDRKFIGLDQKFGRLDEQEQSRHTEQMRLLKEQSDLIQRLVQRIELLEKQAKQLLQAPKPPPEQTTVAPASATGPTPAPAPQTLSQLPPQSSPVSSSPPKTETVPAASPPVAAQLTSAPPAPAPAQQISQQPSQSSLPQAPVPPPAPSVTPALQQVSPPPLPQEELTPPKQAQELSPPQKKAAPKIVSPPTLAVARTDPLGKKSKGMEPATLFAFVLSGASLLLIVVLLIRLKRGEDRIRKMIWKSEMESLREEVAQGRPRLKILFDGEKIDLVNSGEATADEIKFFVGPAPASMKQRVRATPRLHAGERIEIDLHSRLSSNPLYSTLEYKNPDTGRIYKDQFVLKVDRLTGNLLPIQQAS